MVGFVSQLALPVKGEARSVKPARHITVAGKALKLKRPRRVVVCAPRALKGARGESRTEGICSLLCSFLVAFVLHPWHEAAVCRLET